MKVLVLLSLVALCYSRSTFSQRYVTVNEDGTIIIAGANGRELNIHRNRVIPSGIEIDLRRPDSLPMKIEIGEVQRTRSDYISAQNPKLVSLWENYGEKSTQYDVLVWLLRGYEGPLDEQKYESLLEDIHHLVQVGVLHPTVYELFSIFESQTEEYGLMHGLRRVTLKEDDTIVVVGVTGKQITIHRNILNPRKIDVDFKTTNGDVKRIEIDETHVNVDVVRTIPTLSLALKNLGEDLTQYDVLLHLFRQHYGLLDQQQYENLLAQMYQLVQNGVLHESIYDVFRVLDHQQDVSDLTQNLRRVIVKGDDTILILEANGKQIQIHRNIMNPRKIDVDLKTSYGDVKRIEIEETRVSSDLIHMIPTLSLSRKNLEEGLTQYDILLHLFREHQGVLDEQKYEYLLEKIHQLVQVGVVHESIYDVLRFLDNRQDVFGHSQNSRRVIVRGDDVIVDFGVTGKQIYIHKNSMNPRKIDVDIKTTHGDVKRIEIDDIRVNSEAIGMIPTLSHALKTLETLGESLTQHDVMLHLFREYKEILDEQRYEQLLQKLHQLVQTGMLHESIYEVFRMLDNEQDMFGRTQNLKHVMVKGDDTIVVVGQTGKQVDIHKNTMNPRKIDIDVKTPYGDVRRIEIDETYVSGDVVHMIPSLSLSRKNLAERLTQYDVLLHLFHEHQGILDEQKYEYLLENIHQLVQVGVLQESIYDVLRILDNQQNVFGLAQNLRRVIVKDDETIVIVGEAGKQINIHRDTMNPRKFDVDFKTPSRVLKKIKIDETPVSTDGIQRIQRILSVSLPRTHLGEDLTQYDVLVHLFREHQGILDQQHYKHLVLKIHQLVQAGVLHESIYDIFSFLGNEEDVVDRTQNLRRVIVQGDDSIVIVGKNGKQIDIHRNIMNPRKIDVDVKTQYGDVKIIELDETHVNGDVIRMIPTLSLTWRNYGEDLTQYDVLLHLFREHQGILNEQKYEYLLEKIYQLVQAGILHESIYDVLRFEDNQRDISGLNQDLSTTSMDQRTPLQYLKNQQDYEYLPWTKTGQWNQWNKNAQFQRNAWTRNVEQGLDIPQYQTYQYLRNQPQDYEQYQSNPWTRIFSRLNQQRLVDVPQWSYSNPWYQQYEQRQEVPQRSNVLQQALVY